jgi:penicillin-binding protein 1C
MAMMAFGRWMRRRRRALTVLAAALVLPVGGLFALDRLFPPDLSRLTDVSVTVADREGRPLRVFLNGADAWRMPAVVSGVPASYLDLLLAFEDKRFFSHPGVDPAAVLRAAAQNLGRGRVVSGASTLTMQAARLLEPHPRSFAGKAVEALRAVQLEWRYDKTAILGIYLTLAPFGGNLEGVRAAALAYFGKSTEQLTLPEAALLVALPRSPTGLRPDRLAARAKAARDAVLDRAVEAGVIDRVAAEEAKGEPVPEKRLAMPSTAPHLAERIAAGPGPADRRSTIDGALQRAMEDLARREVAGLDDRAGLALLVADHRTREVLAYVGAPDAADTRRFGPIDMVTARRSPGSALKPFIYAMGFDDGLIHPDTLVSDVSTRFGDYAPQNFDRDFAGDLTIREALQRSLNVPAVLVLDRVGPVRFVEALRRAGTRFDLPAGTEAPGLPVALGGGAVSLWDMAALYAGLAREGRVTPLRLTADTPSAPEVPFTSPEAARQVLRILEGAAPPPGIVRAPEVRQSAPIAVKTGTSFGFRDAWAFGVSARYVVGVWVGRPDGTPSPDRYGRNTAAPLVYAAFDRLPADPVRPSAVADDGPAPLQRRITAGDAGDRAANPVRLVFPHNAAVIEAPEDGESLTLEATGGRRPLSWLVDGRRVAVDRVRRTLAWTPGGLGTVRITVVDADGKADTATVEIR